MIETRSSNHHQSKDDDLSLEIVKRKKTTKILGLEFLTYLLENKQCVTQKLSNRRRWSKVKLNPL